MADSQAVRVDHLSVNYEKTPVLWDVSFEVPAGNLVCIVGPNGAGKTTFLKAALGIVKPIAGAISFFDASYKQVRQRIAYVPQRESIEWDFPITVVEVVLMGRYGLLGMFRRVREADRVAAMRYLEMVGMHELAHRQISELSGGQQQRVFVARALMQEADLYLLDEPFAGIDAATEATIIDILRQLRSKGKTVLVVHHNLTTVRSYFDRVVMLNRRLVAAGPVAEVFNADTIEMTYGQGGALLAEAFRLSQSAETGFIS